MHHPGACHHALPDASLSAALTAEDFAGAVYLGHKYGFSDFVDYCLSIPVLADRFMHTPKELCELDR